jgi:hypothetical protein
MRRLSTFQRPSEYTPVGNVQVTTQLPRGNNSTCESTACDRLSLQGHAKHNRETERLLVELLPLKASTIQVDRVLPVRPSSLWPSYFNLLRPPRGAPHFGEVQHSSKILWVTLRASWSSRIRSLESWICRSFPHETNRKFAHSFFRNKCCLLPGHCLV